MTEEHKAAMQAGRRRWLRRLQREQRQQQAPRATASHMSKPAKAPAAETVVNKPAYRARVMFFHEQVNIDRFEFSTWGELTDRLYRAYEMNGIKVDELTVSINE